jgi:phosphoketolase
MKKMIILFIASLIIEIASTFYISAVVEKEMIKMMFWAFIGPFLSLPFIAYQIEAKCNKERLYMAFVYGFGYSIGALIVNMFLK